MLQACVMARCKRHNRNQCRASISMHIHSVEKCSFLIFSKPLKYTPKRIEQNLTAVTPLRPTKVFTGIQQILCVHETLFSHSFALSTK